MNKQIRKAIIPAAGLGTRFLPVTKAQPKEMLPILNKPMIQYIVEEAVTSGISDILIVTGRGKRAIEDHFDHVFELEAKLQDQGMLELLDQINSTNNMANIHYIRQHEPKGLGHAIGCARSFIGDEPFAVLLGDDIILESTPCIKQLMDIYEKKQTSVLAVQPVPMDEVSRYGIVKTDRSEGIVHSVEHLVEKPTIETAPSNLAICGRYILTPAIFPILEGLDTGIGGEIQLTDAIEILNRTEQVHVLEFKGLRYDVGNVAGFVKATIDFALRDPILRKDVVQHLQQTIRDLTATR